MGPSFSDSGMIVSFLFTHILYFYRLGCLSLCKKVILVLIS